MMRHKPSYTGAWHGAHRRDMRFYRTGNGTEQTVFPGETDMRIRRLNVDMRIYEKCPELKSENYLLRLTGPEDLEELLSVYSDLNALPFFNSDNCHGDNFYYTTPERMKEAMDFWEYSYKNGWFARLTIVEKSGLHVIGTVELCSRVSDDAFNGMCILRVDVGSKYETESVLTEIFGSVIPYTDELLGTRGIVTKGPIYAVERNKALKNNGFVQSEHLLVGGHDGYQYNGYWTIGEYDRT